MSDAAQTLTHGFLAIRRRLTYQFCRNDSSGPRTPRLSELRQRRIIATMVHQQSAPAALGRGSGAIPKLLPISMEC
jgi:hypothetical protein